MAIAGTAAAPAAGVKASPYRVCLETGLHVDLAAQRLIKANAFVAVLFLAVGGLFGLLVALTRWQTVHLLDAELFYLALTAHGADVLLFWIIFFEMAVLYFASAILLNCRLAAPRVAWLGYVLMLVGSLHRHRGRSARRQLSVMFTSYVPHAGGAPLLPGAYPFRASAPC